MKQFFYTIIVVLLIGNTAFSQVKEDKQYQIRTLAFYNLENLFDTINNTAKNDEASPMMELKGNKSKVYWDKIDKLGSVLSKTGEKKAKNSPAIIGVVEVENDTVLKDLVKGKFLKDKRYSIIHYDSPDKRGIDVGLLYQKAAALNVKIMEEIRVNEPNAKIITMGDFNDDPIESSFKKILKTKMKKEDVKENDIYNPFESMYRKGFNTAGYRDNINLFDQILISSQLLTTSKDFSTYKMLKAGIYNPKYLISSKGRYKGYPFRSFSWGTYTGGYSDHYPSYMYLIKEKK